MKSIGKIFPAFMLWFLGGVFTPIEAQIFLEFSWTLENTVYEGLLYVPQTQTPTMTVRVLGMDNALETLVLEKVDLLQEENGMIRLQCREPETLWGDTARKHLPETFTAHDKVRGKVSNGKDEAFYEIDTVGPTNIESVMKKYLLDEISRMNNSEKSRENR